MVKDCRQEEAMRYFLLSWNIRRGQVYMGYRINGQIPGNGKTWEEYGTSGVRMVMLDLKMER